MGSFPLVASAAPGAGSFSYGLVPIRHPLKCVVGAPIEIPNRDGREYEDVVDELHAKYLAALRALHEAHKDKDSPPLIFH